jgi:hypothetical protein
VHATKGVDSIFLPVFHTKTKRNSDVTMICRTCLLFHVTSLLRMVLVWSTGRKKRKVVSIWNSDCYLSVTSTLRRRQSILASLLYCKAWQPEPTRTGKAARVETYQRLPR